MSRKPFEPPSPAALLARYVKQQAEAQAEGLAAVDSSGEVQPYEAGPVQPIDAKMAWQQATTVVRELTPDADTGTWQAPPNWPQLVAGHEPVFDLAFCLGNFPQLVRNLQPLLQADDLSTLRQMTAVAPAKTESLVEWAEQTGTSPSFPDCLLALACLRMTKQFDLADKLIAACDVPPEWQHVWTNEKAALAWHRGELQQARELWQQMPESLPVLFNRGMSALFVGDFTAARETLQRVVNELPESTAWHHLARLYLTLAQTRAK